MNLSLSKEVEIVLHNTLTLSKSYKLEFITADTLMRAVLDSAEGVKILSDLGVDVEDLKHQVTDFLKSDQLPKIENVAKSSPQKTVEFTEIINHAQELAISRAREGSAVLELKDILISLLSVSKNSVCVQYLSQSNIDSLTLKKYFSHGPGTTSIQSNANAQTKNPEDDKFAAIKTYGTDLIALAKAGKIDPVIGRDFEIEKVIQILARRKKANPIIVGDPGVGKTAIMEGLALKIANGEVPEQIKSLKVFSIDQASLVAGTKFRGDFEERVKAVVKEAQADPNVLLCIDEIHKLVSSNAASGGSMDASNILKPALANGSIKVLGATTFTEYREQFQKDGALDRRFQKVDAGEPGMEDCLKILQGVKAQYEAYHGITYSNQALEAAVNLSNKFITDKKLPDKAIDLIDAAGAKLKLRNDPGKTTVDEEQIAQVIADLTSIPIGTISSSEKTKLASLEHSLNQEVYGQEHAIKEVVKAVKIAKAGLDQNKDKPTGSYLFAGPTGVGKTELVKIMSKELGMPLLRFDMSEYMEKHAVARLVGAPPGYVGYDKGGELTEKVKKNPYCIVLLDEIEKAHPDIYNVLLQVMDYGKLTDGQGRTTDFKNVILVMTTNLGAQVINKKQIGFHKDSAEMLANDRINEVKKGFAPEFVNRLDSIVQFNSMDKELMIKIVDKNLHALMLDLNAKNVSAVFTQKAKEKIAVDGFDPKMGARPMQRYIKDKVIEKLADEMLFGSLVNGGDVIVDLDDKNEFSFEINHPEVQTLLEKSNPKTKKRPVKVS